MQVYCSIRQDEVWTSTAGDSGAEPNHPCKAKDGVNHTFENDINYFLSFERHGAEVVAVWILTGGDKSFTRIKPDGTTETIQLADGVDRTSGNLLRWFDLYRKSNPSDS